ncbi:fimbria/pilus outer membrane usher protein [Escherichia coli]|nr:fimbria/pilus outer membrane usher protein [Escherichia coli]
MKLKHVGMIVVSVLAMSSAAVSAAEGDESVTTTVNGGVIHFKGEVVNAACAIDSESMNQTVELGQVRSSRLAKAGDLSSAVGFNIKLNDCDTNVSSNAAVAFLGTTVTSNDDTLALQSSAAGSAQNVGIQILDRTGEVLIVPFSHWMRTDSQSAFRNSNASYSMSNDLKGGMTNLSGVYGTLLPDNNLNYSVQVGNTHGGNTSSGTSGYSSLNYRGAYGNTNVGYSRSGDSSQIYYGMSGGIIAHADGITFGQPLGDTMVLVKAPGADNVKIENQTGIHTDWRGYAILPFATEYRENRVALNANSLADNVELDETVITVIPTHGAIARATFNAQIGGKVLMTLKYGNKSVPFGAIVTHGENKNGSIVAENGQVYLTGLPQSGKLQVSWGKDKNSNCIVEYKLPEVSPGTLLNQQTAICR